MDRRMLLVVLVLPMALLAVIGLYHVAQEQGGSSTQPPPGQSQPLSAWVFPAVG